MTINLRFFVRKEDNCIIDRLSPAAKYLVRYCWEDAPEDDMHLREQVLWSRLDDLVGELTINTNPMKKLPNGEEYQPNCEEQHSIFWALYHAIRASHLNTLDVALSIQHRLGGELKREKVGWQDFTSLSLFADDVESLLRDLYGELDNEAIVRGRRAVFGIVEEFTKYLRKDLWQEHQNAEAVDYMCGIGVPEGCGIHGSDDRRGHCAAHDLEIRVRAVRANPSGFSKYTVMFVDELFANRRHLAQTAEEAASALHPTTEEVPF
jgi:hypothetical protein